MEVNVDVLEQMDLMDVSDQEALDVFLNSGSGPDEGALTSPIPGESTCTEEFSENVGIHQLSHGKRSYTLKAIVSLKQQLHGACF